MRIIPIPLFTDNYAYALFTPRLPSFLLIDPAHFPTVSAFVSHHSDLRTRTVSHILSTHKHADHSGDNRAFKDSVPGVVIVGGREDHIDACDWEVEDGREIEVGGELVVRVVHTPCHTRGHVVYVVKEKEGTRQVAFTGDTLFIGGCGRFFEGTASEMYTSLQKLCGLPSHTEVYPGHEYTVSNLQWAAEVDRENGDLRRKLEWAKGERDAGRATVPSTIGEELTYNPFLRAHLLAPLVGTSDPVSSLSELRRWKNEGLTHL